MLSFATIRVEPTFHEASWPDEHICAMRAVDTPSVLAASADVYCRGIGDVNVDRNGNDPSTLSWSVANGTSGKDVAMQQRVKSGRTQPVGGHGNRPLARLVLRTALHVEGNGEVAALVCHNLELPDE